MEGLDWIEQGLTSHSTHFRSFRRRWGDCGINQDCSRSQSPQCVRCTVDNSGVYVYYLKGIVSVCFRCPATTVGFSGTRLYLCIYNEPRMEGDGTARTCYKEQHQAATACWREYETHAAGCSRSAASWYARQPNSTSVWRWTQYWIAKNDLYNMSFNVINSNVSNGESINFGAARNG